MAQGNPAQGKVLPVGGLQAQLPGIPLDSLLIAVGQRPGRQDVGLSAGQENRLSLGQAALFIHHVPYRGAASVQQLIDAVAIDIGEVVHRDPDAVCPGLDVKAGVLCHTVELAAVLLNAVRLKGAAAVPLAETDRNIAVGDVHTGGVDAEIGKGLRRWGGQPGANGEGRGQHGGQRSRDSFHRALLSGAGDRVSILYLIFPALTRAVTQQ